MVVVCVVLMLMELAGDCDGMEELACEPPAGEAVEALDDAGLEGAGASGAYGDHGGVVGRGGARTDRAEGGQGLGPSHYVRGVLDVEGGCLDLEAHAYRDRQRHWPPDQVAPGKELV